MKYIFKRMDADGSGKISVDELKIALWGQNLHKKTETKFLKDFVEEI